jgi:hypothetical protein
MRRVTEPSSLAAFRDGWSRFPISKYTASYSFSRVLHTSRDKNINHLAFGIANGGGISRKSMVVGGSRWSARLFALVSVSSVLSAH